METEQTSLSLFYERNKPLVHSVLMAIFYALFLAFVSDLPFILFLFFLPGATFPLTTSYYITSNSKYFLLLIFIHLLVSIAIYVASVLILLTGEPGTSVFAGFLGSFLYLISVNLFLNANINWLRIFLTALCSGVVFIPIMLEQLNWVAGLPDEWTFSFPVFAWTIINGWLLNTVYKKEYDSTK